MPVLEVHLTECQPDPRGDQMSSWPKVVPLLATRCLYWGVHLTWVCLTVNVKLTLCLTINIKLTWCSTVLCHYMPLLGGTFDLGMSDCKCQAELMSDCKCQADLMSHSSWSANISSNSRNLKLPFFTIRSLYQGVDVPADLPTWALTVEMSYHHSWPLEASTGGVDLPVDPPIWALTVEI